MITRRKVIQQLGLGTVAALAGVPAHYLIAQTSGLAEQALKIPPQLSGTQANAVHNFNLRVQSGNSRFLGSILNGTTVASTTNSTANSTTTPTIGINGDYLGPTLRFRRNSRVALHVHNALTEPTTLHWHGFHHLKCCSSPARSGITLS